MNNDTTLTFLGKDYGFGKQNNSAYYETEKGLVLIDCGFTVFLQVKEKFDFNKYETIHIIITHLHNDHAGSLSQLILYLWFNCNKKAIVVSKCERIKEYLEITGTPKESYEIKQELDNLTFIKTNHTPYLDAYGFNLKLANRSILYTGDTAIIEPFMPYLKETEELYIDVSRFGGAHIKIDDIVTLLRQLKNEGKKIIFMHMDDKEYIEKIAESI